MTSTLRAGYRLQISRLDTDEGSGRDWFAGLAQSRGIFSAIVQVSDQNRVHLPVVLRAWIPAAGHPW